jgi:hypothetical protein
LVGDAILVATAAPPVSMSELLGETLLFVPQSIERALVPHDPKHMVDLYQDVREDDRRRQMLHKDIVIDAEVAVI